MDADRVKAMEERLHKPARNWVDADNQRQEAADMLREMWDENERLKEICAATYQLAGAVEAPVRFLDALSRHEGSIDSLLPVTLDECDVISRLRERITALENKCALLSAALTQAEKRVEELEDTIRRLSAPDTV